MRRIATALLVLALLGACGDDSANEPNSTPAPTPVPSGDDGHARGLWTLTSGHGPSGEIVIAPGTEITLEIADGKASGSGGCNTYGGPVAISGEDFHAGGFAVTEIGCPPEIAEPEQAYLEAVGEADTILVRRKRMTLAGPDTELVFRRVPPIDTKPLTGTTWILDGLVEGQTASSTVSSAKPARLALADDGTFEGTTGCRSFSGTWRASGDVIEITELVFRGDCKKAADQDSHVAAALGAGFRAEVDENTLTITSTIGDVGLVYLAR